MKVALIVCAVAAVVTVGFAFIPKRPSEARVLSICQDEIKSRVPEAFVSFSTPGDKDYSAPGYVENGRLWFSTFVAQDVAGTSVEREFTCEVSNGGAVEVYLYSN